MEPSSFGAARVVRDRMPARSDPVRVRSRVLERIAGNVQDLERDFNICPIGLVASGAVEYPAPGFDPPYRVMLLIAATEGWFVAPSDERERATDELDGSCAGPRSAVRAFWRRSTTTCS